MPNTKISDLSANATQVNSTDVFPSVQTAGVGPVKTTAAQIKTFVNDGATHTGVTAFPAGSAAAPSIIPTGDTNTGVWFPAADTIAASTGGTERMRITSAGNVGIGTSAPSTALDVTGDIRSTLFVKADYIGNKSYTSGQGYLRFTTTDTIFTFNVTEQLRLTSSGNVGIGTASPTALLDVNSDTIRVRTAKTPASATATGNAGDICWDSGYVYVCTAANTWKRAAIATW